MLFARTYFLGFRKYLIFILIQNTLCFPFQICASELSWGNSINLRNINSTKDDFAPRWNQFENRLYFSSDRRGKSKFFVTEFSAPLNFTQPKELTDPLNKTSSNVSYISFVSETEAVLNSFRKGSAQAYLNIFYTQRRLGQWQRPTPLDSLQCECFMLHPTVSPNGSFMIFSSNIGNQNQLDLFVAYRGENGVWGNIEKIEELSTDGDEITPFLSSDDTLYFASNGFGGPGGFDLFYSVRKNNVWQSPIPLSQLNTRFDESDFTVINDTLAVFVSNDIAGLGGLDLYLARRINLAEQITESVPKLDISLSVQIPIIRIQQEFEYEMALFPQVLPVEQLLNGNSQSIPRTGEIPSIEFLLKNYLQLLFQRIIDGRFDITLIFDTTNLKLKDFIEKNINVFRPKFANLSNLVKFEHSPSNYIFVKTQNSRLFEPVRLGEIKEEYEPPVLEFSFNARPEKLATSFEYSIRHTEVRRNVSTIPFFGSIELKRDSLVGIRNSDSLFIDLVAKDSAGRSYLVSYPILLNRSLVSYKKNIIFQNQKYERVYLCLPIKDLENRLDFHQLMQTIAGYSENIKEVLLIGKISSEDIDVTGLIESIANNLKLSLTQVSIFKNISDYESSFGEIPSGCLVLLLAKR
ncbi:MAG: hypothetical protein ACP5LT_06850 [Candidatus Kapaibacteriota bacterium]